MKTRRLVALGGLLVAAAAVAAAGLYVHHVLQTRRQQRLAELKTQCDGFDKFETCVEEWQSGCDDSIGYACRRAAEKAHCGRGRPVDLDRAVALYDRGCGLGDEESCRRLAAAFISDEWSLPRPKERLDRLRFLAAFEAASRGDSEQVARLRAQLDSPTSLEAEFDFLDACTQLTAGNHDRARNAVEQLRKDLPDEPAVRVLARLLEHQMETRALSPELLVKAWAAEGRPMLSGSRFLPYDNARFDYLGCHDALLPPAEFDPSDEVGFIVAMSRPEWGAPDSELVKAAVEHSDSSDFVLAWLAAGMLSHHGLSPEQRAEVRPALVHAVEELSRKAPEDPYFALWSRTLREPLDFGPLSLGGARFGTRRVELTRELLARLSKSADIADPMTAFGVTISAGTGLNAVDYSKQVTERLNAATPAERAEAARHLFEVGTIIASGNWYLDKTVGSAVQAAAADLTDNHEYRQVAQATRKQFEDAYPSRISARLGEWPLPEINQQFVLRAVDDELGFQSTLNALASP